MHKGISKYEYLYWISGSTMCITYIFVRTVARCVTGQCQQIVLFALLLQGGHGTGKTGNLTVNFSRQGKHREFSKLNFLHRENCANTGKILFLKWQQGDGAFLS